MNHLPPISFWRIGHHLRHGFSADKMYLKLTREVYTDPAEQEEQKVFKFHNSPGPRLRYKVWFYSIITGLSTCFVGSVYLRVAKAFAWPTFGWTIPNYLFLSPVFVVFAFTLRFWYRSYYIANYASHISNTNPTLWTPLQRQVYDYRNSVLNGTKKNKIA